MPAGLHSFRMEQGSLFIKDIHWRDRDMNLVDLSTYTPRCTIRDDKGEVAIEMVEDNQHIINKLNAGNFFLVVESTENNAAAISRGTITLTGQPTTADIITILGVVFTFLSTANLTGAANEIEIKASAAMTMLAMVDAINAGCGGIVVAKRNPDDDLTAFVDASSAGVWGDTVTFTESSDNLTIDGGGFLGGTIAGVDGWDWEQGHYDIEMVGLLAGTEIAQGGSYTSCNVDVDNGSGRLALTANGGTPWTDAGISVGDVVRLTLSERDIDGGYKVFTVTGTVLTLTTEGKGTDAVDNSADTTIKVTKLNLNEDRVFKLLRGRVRLIQEQTYPG